MSENGSKLFYLAIGAALGAAVGYIAASDKKDDWIRDINSLVKKVKGNACNAYRNKESLPETDKPDAK